MLKVGLLVLALAAVAFAVSSCNLPCGEPFWKKEKACHSSGPAQ
jgi:hypothetical protein